MQWGLGGTVENLDVRFDPESLDQRQCIVLILPDDGYSVKNNATLNLVFSQLPNLVIRGVHFLMLSDHDMKDKTLPETPREDLTLV